MVAGREVLGLEEISRAEIWRVIWPTEAMLGVALARGRLEGMGEDVGDSEEVDVRDEGRGEHEVQF